MQDWSIISSAAGTIPAAIIADTASPAVLILLKSASSVLIARGNGDRKSTRLNSSHSQISYAVFCLKKKKKKIHNMVLSMFKSKTRKFSHSGTLQTAQETVSSYKILYMLQLQRLAYSICHIF